MLSPYPPRYVAQNNMKEPGEGRLSLCEDAPLLRRDLRTNLVNNGEPVDDDSRPHSKDQGIGVMCSRHEPM